MVAMVNDKKKGIEMYVEKSNLMIKDNRRMDLRYRIKDLYDNVKRIRYLLNISENDVYNYSVTAIKSLADTLKGLNADLVSESKISIKDDKTYFDGIEASVEALSFYKSSNELFVDVVKEYEKFGIKASNLIQVSSVEHNNTVVKVGDLVRIDNRIEEITGISCMMNNSNSILLNLWNKEKNYIIGCDDLVKAAKNVSIKDKYKYTKKREFLGRYLA